MITMLVEKKKKQQWQHEHDVSIARGKLYVILHIINSIVFYNKIRYIVLPHTYTVSINFSHRNVDFLSKIQFFRNNLCLQFFFYLVDDADDRGNNTCTSKMNPSFSLRLKSPPRGCSRRHLHFPRFTLVIVVGISSSLLPLSSTSCCS